MRKAIMMGVALLLAGPARAQEPLDCAAVCCPCQATAALDRDEHGAKEGIGIGLALFIPAYVAGTAYASTLPHSVRAVDSIPIIGALIAGTRETSRDNQAVLFFSAGVQVVGAIVAALSAVELARVRANRVEYTVTVTGDSLALAGRW